MSVTSGDQKLVAALKDHHARIEQMMATVQTTSGEARLVVFRRFRRFLAAHEAAEEIFIHPHDGHVAEDAEVARLRTQEEAAAGELIASLESVVSDSAAFDELFSDLSHAISRHARAEELQELPDVIEASTAASLESMRQALEHVDALVAQRHRGVLGDDETSYETMLESAKIEFRGLRSERGV